MLKTCRNRVCLQQSQQKRPKNSQPSLLVSERLFHPAKEAKPVNPTRNYHILHWKMLQISCSIHATRRIFLQVRRTRVPRSWSWRQCGSQRTQGVPKERRRAAGQPGRRTCFWAIARAVAGDCHRRPLDDVLPQRQLRGEVLQEPAGWQANDQRAWLRHIRKIQR